MIIRLQDIRIRPKLTALLLLTGLLPLVLFWWLENHQTNNWLIEQAISRLETARNVGIADIKRYFFQRRTDMELLIQTTGEMRRQSFSTLTTLRDLKKERVETFFANHLQDLTQLAANPDFIKRIAAIDWLFRQASRKTDDNHWRETVEGFSPWISGRRAIFGIEDLYFISVVGDVSYSLGRKSELGQNIHHNPLKETGLAQIFKPGLEAPVIQDFQPYGPANQVLSAFFAAPVKREGTVIGTVVMRLSRPALTQLMHAGVDQTVIHELFLAGTDGARTDSLLVGEVPIKTDSIPSVKSALEKKTGFGTRISQDNQPVLSAWAPMAIPGLNWAIVVEQEAGKLVPSLPKESKNWLQKFSESAGYFDLFLIHPNGQVFYTTAHQADFGTNLSTGPYANTNLGQLFKKTLNKKQFGMSDLTPYPPSDNQPAFFMAQPVLENNQVVLVVALQLPPDAITGLMRQGANSSGIQTFLVGPDQRLRADAFTNLANPNTASAFVGAESGPIMASQSVINALAGQTGTLTTQRTDGKQVISSFAPMPMDDMTWALIAETQLTFLARANSFLIYSAMGGGLLLLVLAGSWIIRNQLVYPLQDTSTALNRIASGRFEGFDKESRQDELGILTRSVAFAANEIAMAGHRIQHAAEPLSARIRRLASFAIALSREAATGVETISEAKAGVEETARFFVDETNRLAAEQNRLLNEQTRIANNADQMANLTAQAVAKGKQLVGETVTAWNQADGKIRLLQQSAQLLTEAIQKSADEGLRSGKQGKQGKELVLMTTTVSKLTLEIQTELNELEQMIAEHLQTTNQSDAAFDQLAPPMPAVRRVDTTTQAVVRGHTPERTLAALDKLDLLLKKNVSSARDIIIAAKALFDITTGPLRQSTSFFTQNDPPNPEALLESSQLQLDKSETESEAQG